jgi:formylglycine-generating enzyme required for sulfatase activity
MHAGFLLLKRVMRGSKRMLRNIRSFSIASLLVVVALVPGACGTSVPTAPSAETPEAPPPPIATSVPWGDLLGDIILIPAGEFTMGSDTGAADEKPVHEVYVDAFYIGKHEVTNAQYERFVEDTGHRAAQYWPGASISEGNENHPVVNVSWYDARAYCQWLSDQTGQIVRLPTEAEWEKAARGTDGRVYPWGDEFDKDKCNSRESGIGDTTPVGGYSPEGDSPYEVADMAGNVWEWTSSLYKAYPYDPEDGREDPEAEEARVLRGGAFHHSLRRYVRCACRGRANPGDRDFYLGFRVVVSPGSP